jgi:hypothetical protein
MVRMKAVRLHLADEEIHLLEKVRSLGFRSASEVLRCAVLSLADSHCRLMNAGYDRSTPVSTSLAARTGRSTRQPKSGGKLRAS